MNLFKRKTETREEMMGKKVKWVVEFEVDPVWIADGFDLTEERALSLLENALPYAHSEAELGARIIKAPPPKLIKQLQGG